MVDANATSAEQLDAMLEEGTITQEDYEVLRGAMATQSAPEPAQEPAKKPWGKSAVHGALGGVCAGIAQGIGMDAWRVRALFVLAAIVTGGTAVFVYIALCIALPQLDEEQKREPWTFPGGFSAAVAGAWFALFSVFTGYVSRIAEIHVNSGRELPFATRTAISVGDMLQRPTPFLLFCILIPACLIALYTVIPAGKPARRALAWFVFLGFIAVLHFVWSAVSLPMRQQLGTQVVIADSSGLISFVLLLLLACLAAAYVMLPPRKPARRVVACLIVLELLFIVCTTA